MTQDSDQTQDSSPTEAGATQTSASTATTTPDTPGAAAAASGDVREPQFSPMQPSQKSNAAGNMDRFFDVHVPVWAELGRVEMPLGDLMKLDEGAVLRLDRPVGEPVDLVSQGVKLARGEVVVIDDCFAIRIKEIEKSNAR